MSVWLYTFGSVLVVSLLSFIGIIILTIDQGKLKKILLLLVSFAVGGLFGDAIIHLIPESFEKLGTGLNTSLYIVSGILLFFILEKFLHWQHCHIPTTQGHAHPVALMNLVGDGVHNLLDGIIIAGSFLVSIPIGLTTTLAVILHEIPQEIGDFGILIHKGLSVKKALLFNFFSALTAFLGAFLALTIGPRVEGFSTLLLPITAGGFLYIAGSDLIPELHHGTDITLKNSILQFLFIVLGITMMALLTCLE